MKTCFLLIVHAGCANHNRHTGFTAKFKMMRCRCRRSKINYHITVFQDLFQTASNFHAYRANACQLACVCTHQAAFRTLHRCRQLIAGLLNRLN